VHQQGAFSCALEGFPVFPVAALGCGEDDGEGGGNDLGAVRGKGAGQFRSLERGQCGSQVVSSADARGEAIEGVFVSVFELEEHARGFGDLFGGTQQARLDFGVLIGHGSFL
jgi:hypothetical protein